MSIPQHIPFDSKFPVLTICRGLPASGKTTWAKEQVSKNPKTIRVNRDDLRSMLKPGYQFGDNRIEDVVTDASQWAVRTALSKGLNVICDDTNLSERAMCGWKEIASTWKGKLVIKDFTDVPIETCIKRDAERGFLGFPWVGEQVIRGMAYRSGLIKKEKCILVDLDGTLADITERRALSTLPNGKVNFGKFHTKELLDTDKPRLDIIKEVNDAKKLHNCKMIIVSGRSCAEGHEENKDRILWWSQEWLKKNGVNFDEVLMRKQGDYRSDDVVKKEFLGLIGKENVIRIWDDRKQVIDMWRSEGLDVRVCDLNDPINGGDF